MLRVPAVLALVLVPALAAAADKPEKLVETTYDVADLVRGPGKAGEKAVEDLVLLLVEYDPKAWKPAGPGTIREVGGSKLVVATTATRHGEIKEIFAALRRLHGVHVVLKAELHEVPAEFLEKTVLPAAKRNQGSVPFDLAWEKLLATESKKPASAAGPKLANGEERLVVSARDAATFRQDFATPPTKVEMFGVQAKVRPVVSADRRSVKMTVTLSTRDLLGVRERPLPDDLKGKYEEPRVAEATHTTTAEVEDGEAVLVPVAGGATKGKGWVLVLRPTIRIEAEEKERKGKE